MNATTAAQIEEWIALLSIDGANSKEQVITSMTDFINVNCKEVPRTIIVQDTVIPIFSNFENEINTEWNRNIKVSKNELDIIINSLGLFNRDDSKYDDAEVLREQLDIVFCAAEEIENTCDTHYEENQDDRGSKDA